MTNAQINRAFTSTLSDQILDQILEAVSSHYGCSEIEAADEMLHDEAELITDYLTGSIRATVSLFLKAWAAKNVAA